MILEFGWIMNGICASLCDRRIFADFGRSLSLSEMDYLFIYLFYFRTDWLPRTWEENRIWAYAS